MSDRSSGRGSRPLRIAVLVVLVAAILVLLFTVVFPWVERNLSNPTLGAVGVPSAMA